MSEKQKFDPSLWSDRSVEETQTLYRDWAANYDIDVAEKGYVTPFRLAKALASYLAGRGPVLDFGCGTGVSGGALRSEGIGPIHGTDITPEMLEIAKAKGVYERLWLGTPGSPPCAPGEYQAIVAAGVVSLGAAPPETLAILANSLAPGGLLAFSYNDPTLLDARYVGQVQALISDGIAGQVFREHGPHFSGLDMGSDIFILQRL